jgi:ferric-dicitrate binding protein FerR (iron transport regulator)
MMRMRRRLPRRALLPLPALLLSAAGPARVGEALEVTGEARAGTEGSWRGLAPAAALLTGDTLATGRASRLRAMLTSGIELRLGESARLRLDQVAPGGTTLRLGTGSLFLSRENGSRAPAAVVSPAALIAVRGTRLWCGPEDGRFAVLLLHGAAEVIAQGRAVALQDGEGTDLLPGEAPGAPRSWGPPRIARALGSVGLGP